MSITPPTIRDTVDLSSEGAKASRMPSPTSVAVPAITPSRWEELQSKRHALREKAVHLEQRLFYKNSITSSPTIKRSEESKATTTSLSSRKFISWTGNVLREGAKAFPHGHGCLKYRTKQIYTGDMVRGRRQGVGRLEWPDSQQSYEGQWQQDSRWGRGTHTWPDGRTVTGEWKEGHLEGNVTFSWPDGSWFQGYCKHGQKEGKGTQHFANGRVYQGNYRKGLEDGFGILTEAGGLIQYRGEFVEGQRQGQGVQLWMDDTNSKYTKTYEGEWKNNQVWGEGKLTTFKGVYTGQLVRGLFEGVGRWEHGNSHYYGDWKNGKKHGHGRHQHGSKIYVGNYSKGKKSGFGRQTDDDATYVGEWEDGQRHGYGICVQRNGRIEHVGRWSRDCPAVGIRRVSSSCDDWINSQSPREVYTHSDDWEVVY